jgi:hypothetical protein
MASTSSTVGLGLALARLINHVDDTTPNHIKYSATHESLSNKKHISLHETTHNAAQETPPIPRLAPATRRVLRSTRHHSMRFEQSPLSFIR